MLPTALAPPSLGPGTLKRSALPSVLLLSATHKVVHGLIPTRVFHMQDLKIRMVHPHAVSPASVAILGINPNQVLVVSPVHLLDVSRPTLPADGVPLPELIRVVRAEPASREIIFALAANCRLRCAINGRVLRGLI